MAAEIMRASGLFEQYPGAATDLQNLKELYVNLIQQSKLVKAAIIEYERRLGEPSNRIDMVFHAVPILPPNTHKILDGDPHTILGIYIRASLPYQDTAQFLKRLWLRGEIFRADAFYMSKHRIVYFKNYDGRKMYGFGKVPVQTHGEYGPYIKGNLDCSHRPSGFDEDPIYRGIYWGR